ncbi:MAG TPA: hypothetical protein PLY42_14135 [Nitrospira sp.]|nr:hypothetical protein [Nitrospira sp.]MBX7039491.1 hypothetical protein [Nitrospira sp.]MCW5794302.1 hypothetical protein [Nitrospira sp.]HMV56462.1 hypothetical protein [Nitrospira sp.]HMW84724.1 hypothetical protein [Nitrospira sp.]
MTVHRKPTLEQIEPLLVQAHRSRGEVPVGEDWAQEVMRAIRREAAEHPAPSLLAWAEPVVWRVAAGAALVAVCFAGSVAIYTKQHAVPVAAVWLEEFDAGSAFPDK